jgi:hypothetical protein
LQVLVRLFAVCEVKWQVTLGVRQSTCCSVSWGTNERVCVCVCVSVQEHCYVQAPFLTMPLRSHCVDGLQC